MTTRQRRVALSLDGHPFRWSSLLAVFAVTAHAQRTVVVPSIYDGTSGHVAFEWLCWTSSSVGRVQNILPVEAAAVGAVSGIALKRADNMSTNPGGYPSTTVEMELGFGHAATTPPLSSLHFATNRAQDYRIVMSRQTIRFPPVPHRPDNIYPFSYRMPFDTPFVTQAGRWALWEAVVHHVDPCQGQSALAVAYNRWLSPWPTSIGVPCPRGGQPENELYVGPLAVGSSQSGFMNGDFSAPIGSMVSLYLGLRADSWLGTPLPLDLTPLGATGCSVYASLDIAWPRSLTLPLGGSAGGMDMFAIDLPYVGRLIGSDLYLQAFRVGVRANPMGITMSQGLKARIGGPARGLGNITWDYGFGPEYGQRSSNSSFITELTVR